MKLEEKNVWRMQEFHREVRNRRGKVHSRKGKGNYLLIILSIVP
jgi:hypothetical protein